MALTGRLLLFSVFALIPTAWGQCRPEDHGYGSIVCVCDSTYCDTLPPVTRVPAGEYIVYTSSKAKLRFDRQSKQFVSESEDPIDGQRVEISIDREEKYQTILGFGGAFTDATGINVNSLSEGARSNFMKAYFSEDGLEYTLGRIPIGGTDFSTRAYTYNDDHDGDFNLTYFSLQEEDRLYKIPLVQEAIKLSKRGITFHASAWSSPAWMKTSDDINGNGTLIGEPGGPYYKTWAQYYVRFLDAYKEQNITFWGLSAQNEPLDGNINDFWFNCLGFTAESQRDFISLDLGPALESAGYGDIKLMILDDQRLMLPKWADTVLEDPNAARYVSGIAFHFYLNFAVPASVLSLTHEKHPDVFILATEACEGAQPWDEIKVMLGNWERGEHYAEDIINDLLHWTVGWNDWNMALDMEGGPNWAHNYVDSPIIVDASRDAFLKQPMFYVLGHFSKFVTPGSVRINSVANDTLTSQDVLSVAFEGEESSTVLVILNKSEEAIALSINDPDLGYIENEIPAKSIQTYVYWKQ